MKQYLVAKDLEKYFADTLVFRQATFSIHEGQKIALVGPNGSGKSTLAKVIAGKLVADGGTLNFSSNTTLGYASQHVSFENDETIIEIMMKIIEPKQRILAEIRAIEQQFATTDFESEAFTVLSNKYDKLQQQVEQEGVHQLETKIKTLLTRFGFAKEAWNKRTSELSGGQQIRLHLAKLLLEEPDVLILDEPTNHLDIETIIWLENYLASYKKAIIFISHDERLLETISTHTWQIINGSLYVFNGNYRQFQIHLADHMAYLEKQQKEVSEEKARLTEFVAKNIVRASTTKRAQSVSKRLEKMDDVELLKVPPTLKQFDLPVARTSGKYIYKLHDLSVGYTEPLFPSMTIDIFRFERVALLGENGIGKSTLLSTLFNKRPPLSGDFEIGHNVDAAYFEQQQVFSKNNMSVYDTFSEVYPDLTKANIYPILARFGFSQEDVHLNNTTLSGGEKQRLLLAMLYYKKANTLLLDEPTNHLDIESKNALTESLKAYDGTIIFASHDRQFIKNLATKIILFHRDELFYFENYQAFEDFSQTTISAQGSSSDKNTTTAQVDRMKQKEHEAKLRRISREIEAIEKDIEKNENEIVTNNTQLLLEENYSDIEKATLLSNNVQQAEQALEVLMKDWENKQLEYDLLEKQTPQ